MSFVNIFRVILSISILLISSNSVWNAEMRQNNQQNIIEIDPLSVRSLNLELAHANDILGTATGFIVEWRSKYYLITNWHVVSGRDPINNRVLNPNGNVPDKIFIWNYSNVDMIPEVAMPVSIIGFPTGMSACGKFSIWKNRPYCFRAPS